MSKSSNLLKIETLDEWRADIKKGNGTPRPRSFRIKQGRKRHKRK